ncbi:DUF3784 domain-containing protein [Absicoccus intestinalis]|uniref:DUF3784 domain-containing protein n=1 Tax=Absicoccus intestinalis TaxID=2926319 RepID=A0ABU4WL66_9FIRM|nr:DUF3784 domain-containing protein [Absicoccus sp. CLA-KB-P134]MDX8417304.1 DUF3784 domain-containing protein [Absicoccus sp. CLA-KB-P134]
MKLYYILFDLMMAILFFLIGIYFYKSNGKAANFLTGYNMKSIDERKKFNEDTLCKDYGKKMMLWAIPFLIGIGIDIYSPGKGIRIASILWIILFLQFLIERHKRES